MLPPPRERRRLIERRTLELQLAALPGDLDPTQRRAQVRDILKVALAAGREEVQRRFEAGAGGPTAARALCYVIDQLIRVLHDDTAERVYPAPNPTLSEHLSVVAVGGYGRGELAPFSDIDLLFLLPYKQTPRGEQVVEHMLYLLWDLGLKVGHATRSVDECIRVASADITVRTALLEARYVWGKQELYLDLRQRFDAEIVTGTARDFVEAKLAERDARHTKVGDSRYVLEPNIKEGKGGLRDLQTLFWLARYVYHVDDLDGIIARGILTPEEAAKCVKAEHFLWTLRFHLHYLAGRPEERLTFDTQSELAALMGYTDHAGARGVERFMKHYFLVAKDIGDLTRIFCAALEAEQQRKPRLSFARFWGGGRKPDKHGMEMVGERLDIAEPDTFFADPVNIIRLFHTAQESGLDIHPNALRQVSRNLKRVDAKLRANPEANRLFLEILAAKSDPEAVLRRLSEAGVFSRFVPDFGRIVAQMQYDMYHVYTVDEHTLFAIGTLSRIENGLLKDELPLATAIVPTLASRRALYVAVLLHDIAKGRGGDHSVLGEQVAHQLGPRFGLTDEETDTVAWLVRNHLIMSDTAFRRDLQDPETIKNFAAKVQSPERLKLLLVLTAVDIRAVGPKVWNNWKAGLLREIYASTDALLTGGLSVAESGTQRVEVVKNALRQDLADWSDADFAEHLKIGNPAYWLSADPATLARQARLIRRARAEQAPLAIDTKVDPQRGITEVTILTGDHPGLFARIAGALAVSGANIVDARIYTLTNGMALDSFSVQDTEGGLFDRPNALARLAVLVEQALGGRLRQLAELKMKSTGPTRTRVFTVKPRVLIDNDASATHTVLELNGRDRPGLLYEVGRALHGLHLQISTARIATYGEQVVDVFYVKDLFGLKIFHETKLAEIRDKLLAALADPNEIEQPASARRQPTRRNAKSAAE